ncbi:MAG: hypothetical protein CL946_13000 [Ectothiorhodospiraceae bacterium]|nr:hypothetical protein [Ectothiorhodospiraceae bacterium]
MRRNSGSVIILFARHPEPGKTKTRLAVDTGPAAAAQMYRVCAEHVYGAAKATGFELLVSVPAQTPLEKMDAWLGAGQYHLQPGGTIGVKMRDAFEHVFKHGANRAILIGTDVPDVTSGLLTEAHAALQSDDVVIGPAMDGGFWLIGMNAAQPQLFANIEWSTDTVYERTVQNAAQSGLSLGRVAMLRDIDTYGALQEWLLEADEDHPLRRYMNAMSL